MMDFLIGLGLLMIMLAVLFDSGKDKGEDPKKLLRKAQADCPMVLYEVVYDEVSPKRAYIAEYPTEGLYIKWAGDYIAVDELDETVFLTKEAAEAAKKEKEIQWLKHLSFWG